MLKSKTVNQPQHIENDLISIVIDTIIGDYNINDGGRNKGEQRIWERSQCVSR